MNLLIFHLDITMQFRLLFIQGVQVMSIRLGIDYRMIVFGGGWFVEVYVVHLIRGVGRSWRG